MQTINIILVMIAAIIVSSWIIRILPLPIPIPIIQIILGYLIAQFSGGLSIPLEPHVFMYLFLPPLLFLDGWRIPKAALRKDMKTILLLAFGLVFFTVVGIGYLIHWMIPAIPLPVAFALAAVISPTDPVAVSAIAQKIPFPPRMMHILEGESLFNDASGLVCLKFAVVAATAGSAATFSLSEASYEFIQMVIGGILIGIIVTWGISRLKQTISRRWGEDSGTQILISLLIPFIAYFVAEQGLTAFHIEFSGVLAAVAAGITMNYSELKVQVQADTRIRRNAVWDSIQILANGAMFVLLGEQLPEIVGDMHTTVLQAGHENICWLFLYVILITFMLIGLRWLWVWVSLKIMLLISKARGKETTIVPVGKKLIAAMSIAGVRGSITLAGVLTIPMVVEQRNLTIFLASGVILMTLILASVALPRILHGLELPKALAADTNNVEDQARIATAQAAIKAVEQAQHDMATNSNEPDIYINAANRIMGVYRSVIETRQNPASIENSTSAASVRKAEEIERRMLLTALAAERDTVYKLAQQKRINEELMNKLIREIDFTEARFSA